MDAAALPHDLLGLSTVALLLGLRHGFDADHLATIDALTRYQLQRGAAGVRWIGALFSLGHGAVVTIVALAVSLLASRWQAPAWLTSFGAWTSITVLVLLALLNIANLARTGPHDHPRPIGLRSRGIGGLVRGGPLAAAGLGALFALSFDTLSIAALFAISAHQHAGELGALQCALAFTLGMLVTDGLNGVWITRLLRRSDHRALRASRLMGWAVVAISLLTAAYALARQMAAQWPEPPEWLPGVIVTSVLLGAFWFGRAFTMRARRAGRAV